MPPASSALAAFDLKSTTWTLTALRLHSADPAVLAQALDERFQDTPGLFDGDPVVLDLTSLRDADEPIDFAALLPLLRRYQMEPIAVQSGGPAQTAAALAAGLADAMEAAPAKPAHSPPAQYAPAAVESVPALAPTHVPEVQLREIIREVEVLREVEVVREVPGAAVPTMVVDKPLR